MIHIEMRNDNITHVLGLETHTLDLADRRLTLATPRPDERAERLAQTLRRGDIGGAQASVEENEAVAGLDQETVRNEGRLGER